MPLREQGAQQRHGGEGLVQEAAGVRTCARAHDIMRKHGVRTCAYAQTREEEGRETQGPWCVCGWIERILLIVPRKPGKRDGPANRN